MQRGIPALQGGWGGHSHQPGQALLPAPASWPCAHACVLLALLPALGPAARSLQGGLAPTVPQGSNTGCLPAVWLTTQNHSTLVTERSAVPFLPVNPEYSATRNQVRARYGPVTLPTCAPRPPLTSFCLLSSQGRQKLARFNAREFATLLIDILGEAKRRQQGKSLLSPTGEGQGTAKGDLSISPCPLLSIPLPSPRRPGLLTAESE